MPPAFAPEVAEGSQAGHRLPAGTQSREQELPRTSDKRGWLPGHLERPKELERRRHPIAVAANPGVAPLAAGYKTDNHSRYLEAIVGKMVIACIYLPNGNPYPRIKFDYKLKWFSRLSAHAKKLLAHDVPVMIIGDYNVMPTELDVYKPEKYLENALFRKEVRAAYQRLLNQGWTDALRALHPDKRIYTFWDYLRYAWERDTSLRLDHFLLNDQLAKCLKRGVVDKQVRGWPKASDHTPVWIEIKE